MGDPTIKLSLPKIQEESTHIHLHHESNHMINVCLTILMPYNG
jgi:hypothetical protein